MDRNRDRARSLPSCRLDDHKLPSPPSSCSSRDRDKGSPYPRFDSPLDRSGSDRSPPDKVPSAAAAPRDRDCRERGGDGGRESWRKGHGAERENGDGGGDEGVEKAERGRNSFRKTPGYERDGIGRSGTDRHYVAKASDRDRSERSDGPRTSCRKVLEHDRERESFDKVEAMRYSGRRNSASDHRQEIAESSNNSPLHDERESTSAAGVKSSRKSSGPDREKQDRGDLSGKTSSAPGRDEQESCDLRRSPPGKSTGSARDVKDVLRSKRAHGSDRDGQTDLGKGSPRKEFGVEKDGTKSSPRKEYATEKDPSRTPRMSPRKAPEIEKDATDTPKVSPRKSNGPDRDLEMEEAHRISPKPKHAWNRDEDRSEFPSKGYGSSSDEGDTRSRNRSSSSRARGGSQNAAEEAKQPGVHSSPEDGWRKRSPQNYTSSFHISKKLRSDRDRGRREDKPQSLKVVPSGVSGVEVEEAEQKSPLVQKLEVQRAAEEQETVTVDGETKAKTDQIAHVSPGKSDVTAGQSDSMENLPVPESSTSPGDKSEMEEGELEPEEEMGKEEQKVETKDSIEERGVDAEMEVEESIAVEDASHIDIRKEEEACERMLGGAPEGESQQDVNGSGTGSDENQKELGERYEHGDTMEMVQKEEEKIAEDQNDSMNLRQSKTAIASTSKDGEVGESYPAGLTLDLLHERTTAQRCDPVSGEKDHDSSRELALSLSTKPIAAESSRSKQKGPLAISQSSLNDKLESPERPGAVRNVQGINKGKDVAIGAEELGEHSHAGFDLKHKQLKMDYLQLSLALPGISSAMTRPNPPQLAGPVEPERSCQSLAHTQSQTQNLSMTQTHTNSDGFTTSFSQSHSFVHNPSCSLNCNSLDNQELSCGGSRQISQGNEQISHRSWQSPSANEQASNGAHGNTSLPHDRWKHRREIPLYQQILQNGNVQLHHGFPSVTGSKRSSGSNQMSQRSTQIGRRLQAEHRNFDVSSQDLKTSDRRSNLEKDLSKRLHQKDTRLISSKQGGPRETQSEPHLPLERESLGDYSASPAQRLGSVRNEGIAVLRNQSNEKIGLCEIATEPVTVMAQRLQELPDSFLDGLKDLAKEMLGSIEKRGEFIKLQGILQTRTDLTEDALLRSHRTQLEILVAFKTGLQSFVQKGTKPLTYKALIEIFLETRCRNIACQQSLPVDRCECKICSQKSGFCSYCMCVVCSKFDSDNNTCRWVGCDLCEHWCHTDCGLRLSYIAPAPSNQGAASSEMQFKCVACGHNLELFGFVKQVFQNFSDAWGAETVAKELDCVRRIFHGSEDMKGKQLCWKAEQMLQKLENKVDVKQVCRSMLQFFIEGNAQQDGAHASTSKQPHSLKPIEASDRVPDVAKDLLLKVNPTAGNKGADMDRARAALQTYDKELEEKRTEVAELQYDRARKKAEIDNFESMVRMKQAEANMFQVRADEARHDANGLQRIAAVKRGKIEEDYACKYAKLRLEEAEDSRRKWLEEVQALERVLNDFRRMKTKTEAEIKDLLMKMEMTKQQFV